MAAAIPKTTGSIRAPCGWSESVFTPYPQEA
jgi:hypothetical protein